MLSKLLFASVIIRLAEVRMSSRKMGTAGNWRNDSLLLTSVALVNLPPDRTSADVGAAEGGSVVAQEGMGRIYEQDLVNEVLYLARRCVRIAGATGAFLKGGKLFCGLAIAHSEFCPLEHSLLTLDRQF